MTGDTSALQLVLSGDPALFAIVHCRWSISLSAVLFAALIGVPVGALLALTRFPGREAAIVVLNALMGLPPVVVGLGDLSAAVALRPARLSRPAVHACRR